MNCNCNSRFDSLMNFLEELKSEISFVKNKCIRIEREVLGITNETAMNADALMETTTVRHLMEEMAHAVSLLTENSSRRDEAVEQIKATQEAAASRRVQLEFEKATPQKIAELQQKYDLLDAVTFETEFKQFQQEFLSQTEINFARSGFPRSNIDGVIQRVTATNLDELFREQFLKRNEEFERTIREELDQTIYDYAKDAISQMLILPEISERHLNNFLENYTISDAALLPLKQNVLPGIQNVNRQIEENRNLVEELASRCREINSWVPSGSGSISRIITVQRKAAETARLYARFENEIKCDTQLRPLFREKISK